MSVRHARNRFRVNEFSRFPRDWAQDARSMGVDTAHTPPPAVRRRIRPVRRASFNETFPPNEYPARNCGNRLRASVPSKCAARRHWSGPNDNSTGPAIPTRRSSGNSSDASRNRLRARRRPSSAYTRPRWILRAHATAPTHPSVRRRDVGHAPALARRARFDILPTRQAIAARCRDATRNTPRASRGADSEKMARRDAKNYFNPTASKPQFHPNEAAVTQLFIESRASFRPGLPSAAGDRIRPAR